MEDINLAIRFLDVLGEILSEKYDVKITFTLRPKSPQHSEAIITEKEE